MILNSKHTECKICYIQFNMEERRALLLPCGHTYCKKCLQDTLNNKG